MAFHHPNQLTRRDMLTTCATGFGAVALAAFDAGAKPRAANGTHHEPRAKNVIFLYMDGGVSQVDSFDYKPMLERYNGRDPHTILQVEPTQFNNVGRVMMSPWRFRQHGQCGRYVSELFPHIARHVDDLAFIHSMTSRFSEHTGGNFFLHTGSGQQGRPSMGAWISYGLGSENRNLPTFVVLNGGLMPAGGFDNFGSGFLPAAFQGSVFRPGDPPVAYIRPQERDPQHQAQKLDLLRQLDRAGQERLGQHGEIESAIANYETAFRMQTAVPELMDLTGESNATKELYGINSTFNGTRVFGTECLLARRLVERGVRFVELTCPSLGHDRWDQHSGLRRGHEDNARAVDQPIAGLLHDLKARGLFDETLVVWTGEFGRTPFAQGTDGRDHNPFGFTLWMAGAGVRPGVAYGATDEFGYKAVDGVRDIHDLHATMLHLLGVDHTRQTFRFGGRDMRLTDVHGDVIHEVLA